MQRPVTPNERISDLRFRKNLSQKELSDLSGVDSSQISRIERGEIKSISSDVLIKLAKALRVSTDYILGLTTISAPKSYDISELGLSEGAVRALVTCAADVRILNRLLEHKKFPALLDMVRIYFEDTGAVGIMGRNELLSLATAKLSDFRTENPEHATEIKKDMRFINAQKIGEHEADIEKIKAAFLAILKDIKKDMESGVHEDVAATADFARKAFEQLAPKTESPESVGIEDVAAVVANMFGQATALDSESAGQMQTLMKLVAESIGQKYSVEDDRK